MRAAISLLCSAAAFAGLAAVPAPALAQRSFQGSGQVVFGSASIDQTSGTVVRVGSPQAVINWTPDTAAGVGNGNSVIFQPAGTTALFTTPTGSTLTDFAVLNRILPGDPSRPIELNGTILSRLQGNADQAAGTVYFYSPGGIVVGASAVIDVGSLGLTTSDPWSGSGPWLSADRTVVFASSAPGRAVSIAPGASLTSSGSTGSYTAIVAPQVLQSGTIRTSGGAALVAADAATITFSPDNLYSIQVSAPTAGSNGGLFIDGGSIGRTLSGPVAATQRLYLVSIPKNSAVTMLIQGGADLGFTPAGQASVDGDAIVLSAGRDIAHGALAGASNGLAGNATIQNATFRDHTVAGINGSANFLALSGDLRFAGDLRIEDNAITLRAENGHALSVGGTLVADASGVSSATDTTGFGGSVTLAAGKAGGGGRGGSISVGGGASLLANGTGAASSSGTGGVIGMIATDSGRIGIGGDLSAAADGIGGAGTSGGTGTGGSIELNAQGGTIALRNATLHSDGVGGTGQGGSGGDAATGRLALLVGPGGALTANTVSAHAGATGGSGLAGVGRSVSTGGNRVQLTGGQLHVGQLGFTVAAATSTPDAVRDLVAVDHATADVDGGFGVTTSNALGVSSDGGRLTAGSITLGARTFTAEAAPVARGSFNALQLSVTTAGDLLIGANLKSLNGFAATAPGKVALAGLATSAGGIAITSGGLLTIDGAWTAPTIDLTSSDIALGSSASLTASGAMRLTSTNASQMLLGDGLSGSGYALSDAEFGRLRGDSITLSGRADASAPLAIQVGKLTLAGAQLGSSGLLRIVSATPSGRAGVIGITGQMTGNGIGAAQTVEFEAARVQVDAGSGGISLGGNGAAPGGQLSFRTDRLWVAEADTLNRLAANSAYTGREADLARVMLTPRPAGVVRAGTISFVDPHQILVQNSGTKALPAGLTSGSGSFLGFVSAGAPAGPVELIVNGQIVAASGTATGGFAVQAALNGAKASSGFVFTPNSSVNGCLVNASSCAPTVVTRDEDIHLGFVPFLPDKLFGDDDDDRKRKSSAITPAEKLVDRRPLEKVRPIDEPVSGAGNPAMMGATTSPGGGR
ncbi:MULTISPECIES: beta strand repeat-containing protein [Sphingomonas]|uniref:beta strand repeat-containing protein n=1 Tax=Sphingomonas TaxID=13687 RepID=UPI0013B442B3|nr:MULTISPECIES: hypothetical protein [Sphingomonas]